MDVLFVIPTLVSPSVPENMIPSIAKLVERNILSNYYSIIRRAVEQYLIVSKPYLEAIGSDPDEDEYNEYRKQYIQLLGMLQDKNKEWDQTINKMGQSGAFEDEIEKTNKKFQKEIKRIEDHLKSMERNLDNYMKLRQNKLKGKLDAEKAKRDEKTKRRPGASVTDKDMDKPITASLDQPEVVKGIEMFSTISLEPTVAIFPINILKKDNTEVTKTFRVGVKAVPYVITNDMDDLIAYMAKVSNHKIIYNMLTRFTIRKINRFRKRFLILTKPWRTRRGYISHGDDPKSEVMFTLDIDDIRSPRNLMKKFKGVTNNGIWTTLLVLDRNDIENTNADAEKIFGSYKKLASLGWGDMVVIDSEAEIVNFCSLSLLHCIKYPLSYLKKILNVKDIIDFSELNRTSKMFSMKPYKTIMRSLFSKKG